MINSNHATTDNGTSRSFQTRRSPKLTRFVVGCTLAAAPFVFVGAARAQTSSTQLGASTTVVSTATTSSVSAVPTTPVELSSTLAAAESTTTIFATATTLNPDATTSVTDTTISDAVPQGGIDAGFGGTAPANENTSDIPAPVAVLLFVGAAIIAVVAGRRSRS
jgi:hypothetical protein